MTIDMPTDMTVSELISILGERAIEMTIAELIEKLSLYNPNAIVVDISLDHVTVIEPITKGLPK